jgi:hypothetical protein
MALNWQHVTVADYRKLRDARILAHYGTQWLARAARAYIAARPHDGHISLGWGDKFRGLVTHALPDGSRLGLRIPDLTLSILDTNDALPLDGRAESEVRAWLGSKLQARGYDAAKLDGPLPYDMPHNVVALGARYSIEELIDPLNAIAVWFANGNAMLSAIRDGLVTRKLKAPEVRCWPHHFDMDSLIHVGGSRAVGSGFCLPGALHPGAAAAAAGRPLAFVQVHRGAGAGAQDRRLARPAARHRGLFRHLDRRRAEGSQIEWECPGRRARMACFV